MDYPSPQVLMVKNVSKTFRVGSKKTEGALAQTIGLFSGREDKREIQVLQEVSFSASRGEIVGIIGKNGSGKSTLLRIIAGIYEADKGTIQSEGTMVYLSGYGQGLRPKLTMEENIYLICSIMGLSRREAKIQFQKIVDFSELGDYLYTKVYQFSSGMVTRLSFSIAVHCLEHHNPDIFLADEILSAGGDRDFQKKAGKKMEEFVRRGSTVLLVSHNPEDIVAYCTKVLLLEKGKLIEGLSMTEALKKYES